MRTIPAASSTRKTSDKSPVTRRYATRPAADPFKAEKQATSQRLAPRKAELARGLLIYLNRERYAPSLERRPRAHGGARLRAGRTSDGLTLTKACQLIAATEMARSIGRPLNRHITVHWEAAGVADSGAAKATTAFLKYLREWLGGRTAYVWARENGDGKGSHLHILAHIPTGRRMNGVRSRRWIERITGRPYRPGTICTRRIAGSGDPAGPVYAVNFGAALAYVLKGAAPDVAAALGIDHEPGGRIIGKRCGTSRNIDAKARRAI